MPIFFIEERPCEDDDVEDDAETVKAGECGHQGQEAGLEVEGSRGDDS